MTAPTVPPVLTARISGLHVEVVGEGAPLLVAHGGPGASHGVYRTLDPLGSGRQLVFWDHRGHGRSDALPDREVVIADFADDVIAVADGLGIEEFVLFGHSFGGWVAQEAALRHPDRIAGLVLAGTTPGQVGATESPADDQGPPPPTEVQRLMGTLPATDAEAAAMYDALTPYFSRTSDPTVLVDALHTAPVSASSMARVFAALGRWSSFDRLVEIACRTLVVAGEYDVFCSVQQHERIARRLPDPQLVVIPDVGHFMWLERPAVLDLMGDWLSAQGW